MSLFARRWITPGPVMDAFLSARKPVECVMGPVGSGKTSGALIKPTLKLREQKPGLDGKRKRKVAVVRDTYVNLWKSTIPTWWKWMPPQGEGIGWNGAVGHPAQHRITVNMRGLGEMEIIYDFIAIGDRDPEDAMRGYEVTDWILDEADRLQERVLSYGLTRLGRYPEGANDLNCHPAVHLICNAPEFDTWLADLITDTFVPGVDFFRQPPALVADGAGGYVVNDKAENIHNVTRGYYQSQADAFRRGMMDEMEVRRMLLCEFGYSREGKPIYADNFRDGRHVAKHELEPDKGLKLVIGVDGGRSPAATFRQVMPNGQRRVLDEICCDHGTSIRNFASLVNRKLAADWREWGPGNIVCGADPATFFGADKLQGESAWVEIFAAETGLRVRPGGDMKNSLTVRLDAINATLRGTTDGEQPLFLLSPRCRRLRKAMNGGYRWRRVQVAVGGSLRWSEEPVKDDHSHVCDADQYGELVSGGYAEILGRRRARSGGAAYAATENDSFGGRPANDRGGARAQFAAME